MGKVGAAKPKRAGWRVLARHIAKQLPPGFTRFQTEPTSSRSTKRIAIVAHYHGRAPKIAPFKVTIGGEVHSIAVRTRASRAARPMAAAPGFGMYPGAAIALPTAADLGNGAQELGAICALLSASADDAQPSHLMTCGHMFPPGAQAISVIANGQVVGTLVKNLLNASKDARDVALVALNPAGRALACQGGAGPQLEDYLPADQIFSLTVRTYRPTTGAYSAATKTAAATTPSAHISAALWPNGFSVEDVIATTSQVSSEGDSGTILATPDPIAIGSCSASGGGQSLFEPIGRAIDDVFLPQFQLTLWKNP